MTAKSLAVLLAQYDADIPDNDSSERIVPSRVREGLKDVADSAVLSFTPQMYGAVGDGVADDTAAVQAMFNAVTGTAKTAYLPNGNYLCGTLSALGVRNLVMDGYITSTVTTGCGILLGTETNANTAMVFGAIKVRIRRAVTNANAEGTDGIRIRGAPIPTFA